VKNEAISQYIQLISSISWHFAEIITWFICAIIKKNF